VAYEDDGHAVVCGVTWEAPGQEATAAAQRAQGAISSRRTDRYNMPIGPDQRYDFFLSRRGSVRKIAREVADVLIEKGYKVLVQDYDIPLAASFIEAMHEAVKNSRDLLILFTRDYEESPHTRKEFTSFEAEREQSTEKRYVIVLRCEDVPLRGLLADNVYQDLVGITDREERKRRIIAAAERQSQGGRPPPRPFTNVPPRIASFIGRNDELDRLDAILMDDKAQPAAVTQSIGRAAVQGLGGIGKTSFAVEYANRYRGLYTGVCWCAAETREDLVNSLAVLAEYLGALPAKSATDGNGTVEKAAKAALRLLAEQRTNWLLVYDNVPNPRAIADLLPSGGARVLITSRFPNWSGWASEIALDSLPLSEAVDLLQLRAKRTDKNGAEVLALALGGLPLALDHAAAHCQLTGTSFAEYATTVGALMDEVPEDSAYPRSVAATFTLALEAAAKSSSSAEPLITYLSMAAPERIPLVLVDGAIEDDRERRNAVRALAAVALLRHDPFEDGSLAVTVHRLVQTVARARSKTIQTATARMIRRLLEIYPDVHPDASTLSHDIELVCARLTPHLLACRELDPNAGSNSDWSVLNERERNYSKYRSIRFFVGVPPRLLSFVGRDDLLKRIELILTKSRSESARPTLAVTGLGGMGKTAVAVEYAHRCRDKYAGVCWCRANSRTMLLVSLATLAITLGVLTKQTSDPESDAKAALAELRLLASERDHKDWLLIYDDVTSASEIADLLPDSGAQVLITSRSVGWSGVAEQITLDGLSAQEGSALIQTRAERGDHESARKLTETLGGLPLALEHAGAYLKLTQLSFEEYATRLKSAISTARTDANLQSVVASFFLAIERASAQSPAAEILLAYLAHCAPGRIPMTLVEGALENAEELHLGIEALISTSLVNRDTFEDGTPALTLHPLVRVAAQSRSRASGVAKQAITRLATRLAAMPEDRRILTDTVRLTADALDGLGRMHEAAVLRERYSIVGGPEKPTISERG
jgi:hypothetical protein